MLNQAAAEMNREGQADPRLSVCEITTRNWAFDEDVEGYLEAGLEAMGLWWDKVQDYGSERAAALLRSTGLTPANMVGVPFLLGDGEKSATECQDDLLHALDCCVAIGVHRVGVVPGNRLGRSVAEMETLTVEALARLGAEAAKRDIVLALEPIHAPYFDFLNTLADADRLVRQVNHPAVGILFDAWHLCHEPQLFDRIEQAADKIVMVHFSDWREPTRFHDDRLLPGDGVLPLHEILGKLHAVGYAGFYDVEVFSTDLWNHGNYQEMLQRCRTWFANFRRRHRESVSRRDLAQS